MQNEELIRARIQAYLSDVAAHLEGMPDQERQDLLRQLESHIHEALQARTGSKEPQVSDIEAVLAEMDRPESYATAPKNRLGGLTQGQWALLISLGSLAAAGFLVLITGGHMTTWIPPFWLFLGGQVAAFVIGILSWRDPFGKAAVYTSAALTVVSVLFVA